MRLGLAAIEEQIERVTPWWERDQGIYPWYDDYAWSNGGRTCDIAGNPDGEDDQAFFEANGMGD